MSALDWSEEPGSDGRWTGRAGTLDVATVLYDGGNRFWVWSSPLADDAWGWGPNREAGQRGFEAWLRRWLANFRPFLDAAPSASGPPP